MRRTLFVAVYGAAVLGTMAALARAAGPMLSVSTDFEGGSALVHEVDQGQRLVRLSPGGLGERGWPAWWCVRLEGVKSGESVTLELSASPEKIQTGAPIAASWSQPDRAAISYDGVKWGQTELGKREGKIIRYTVALGEVKDGRVWLAWGPPFTPRDAESLLRRLDEASDDAAMFELATSRGGRKVYGLHVNQKVQNVDPPYGVWIQARQHAWESGASWVARGLGEWLVSDDVRAIGLRQLCHVYLVPIMDVDNAATGNGGKQAVPQDHNRDWTDEPHWPEVKAAQERIVAMSKGTGFDLFVDLHNPGPGNKLPYLYVDPEEQLTPLGQRNLKAFLLALNAEVTSPWKMDLPRPTGPKYDKLWQQISHHWVKHHTSEHVVGGGLETPWNTPVSTPEGYMEMGKAVGLAIERYFRVNPRK